MLQSCNDDNNVVYTYTHTHTHYTVPHWATVCTIDGGFYLESDRWGTLYPTNVELLGYEAVDGQRVITSFSPLEEDFEGYDYAVDIRVLKDVLTKSIEPMESETEVDYGTDPLLIYKGNMRVSGGYLNVVFSQNIPANGNKHLISLHQTAEDADENGYLHFELRYNDYNDLSGRRKNGFVSFNLGDIDSTIKGIVLKLNSEVNGKVEVTLHNNDANSDLSDSDTDGSTQDYLQ